MRTAADYKRTEALREGDACEFRYPARTEWQPGEVVRNGGSGYWSVRDLSDSEGKRGQVTSSLYIEHVRAPKAVSYQGTVIEYEGGGKYAHVAKVVESYAVVTSKVQNELRSTRGALGELVEFHEPVYNSDTRRNDWSKRGRAVSINVTKIVAVYPRVRQ